MTITHRNTPAVSDSAEPRPWFTIERLDDTTFSLAEYGQWMKLHSYLLLGEKRAALIDTGLGIGNIHQAVSQITELPVTVLSTHAHWDHIGNHDLFSEVWVHQSEHSWLAEGYDDEMEDIRSYLLDRPFTQSPPSGFELNAYRIPRVTDATPVEDEQTLDLGNRLLRLIHTPGHSPGHLCIHDTKSGYVATGDLLYQGTLLAGLSDSDPAAYFSSLKKIQNLPHVSQLLPGHGKLGLGPDLITEAVEAFHSLTKTDQLKKGTGQHRFNRLWVQL